MGRLGALSGRDIIKALAKVGYLEVRRHSSHIRLAAEGKRSLTVPDYNNISQGLVRKILRDAEISLEDFHELLGK